MRLNKNSDARKQEKISNWILATKQKNYLGKSNNDNYLNIITKPKLAFGYGYDPNLLRGGIKEFNLSHSLKNGLKLYEFTPKLPYRLFHTLANILKYNCVGSEIRKGNTIIKNKYFISDKNPEKVVKEINQAIELIFKNYKPITKN